MKNFAFTLAETLITMSIIGIVATVVVSGIKSDFADKKEKAMFRKCHATLEETVNDLINNENNYPQILSKDIVNGKHEMLGFANMYDYRPHKVEANENANKFCELFISKLAFMSKTNISDGKCTFTLKNNSFWYIDSTSINIKNKVPIYIYFDVNGKDTSPNCPMNLNNNSSVSSCPKPDTFKAEVYNNGSIIYSATFNDTNQLDYLTDNKFLFNNEAIQAK